MNYEIVATLGPGSDRPTVWSALITAGATAFRLNTSHITLQEMNDWLQRLNTFFDEQENSVHLVLDLQGSKWRLGQFPSVVLKPGDRIALIPASETRDAQTLPVPHADFFHAAAISSDRILLNDARNCLMVESIQTNRILTRVLRGGTLTPRKGITFSESDYRQEKLGETDRQIVEQTHSLSGIRYAISYVRDANEMQRYRTLLGQDLYLIAKLERLDAVKEAIRIAEQVDEVWLCRGDLGAELGFRALAQTAHRFARDLQALPVPAFLAGQVLDHMSEHPTPTRAELCNLYDSLCCGYHGVVLSDETAVGRYPIESCQTAALFRK